MTLQQVEYVSRRDAEQKAGKPDWAVISISDPLHYPAMLGSGWHSILRLEFSDIEHSRTFRPIFTPQDAQAIITFVRQADIAGCTGMLVHCKAGISRSAAIAKWIATTYQLATDYTFDGHNKLVYATLCELAQQQNELRNTDEM